METVVLRPNGVYDLNFDASGASNKKSEICTGIFCVNPAIMRKNKKERSV